MKKILVLIVALSVILVVRSYAQDKKVAVVTFYTVKQIGYTGKASKEAMLNSAKLADDSAYNMLPILKSFHDQFFKNYANKFPFQLLPEKEVVNNTEYKSFIPDGNAVDDILSFKTDVSISGYKVLPPLKKYDNEKNLLAIFNNCDGLMKIYLNFELDKRGSGGLALVKVKANVNIDLFNKNGEKVFSVTESALSQLSATQVTGIQFMIPRKILPLCENAIDELMIVLQQDMPKIAERAGAKL
jgi:hypothetical protein